jgi:hypothetical protein
MDPRAQLAKLKKVSRLERMSQIPEFCQGLIQHIFTVPATAPVARNILEYTLAAIMTPMPPIEEAEPMEEVYSPTPVTAVYSSPAAIAYNSPAAAAAYASPRGERPVPYSAHEPISARKERISRRRLRLGNENENENEAMPEEENVDPEHVASVAEQVEAQEPTYVVEQELQTAYRGHGVPAVLQLCLSKVATLFENDIKAKGTMDLGNILNYTTRSYSSKRDLDHILQRVFKFPVQPAPSDQAEELIANYTEGVKAIMASSGGRRTKRRRSRRLTSRG